MKIRADVPSGALVAFVAGVFAITWGVVGAYIFWPDAMTARFGALELGHPFYFIGTWAPAIMGIGIVAATTGWGGLRAFLGRLLLWRTDLSWWLLILVGIPLVFMAGSLLKGGGLLAELPEEGIGVAFLFLGVMLFLGPMEEFGWRGLVQPILQRHVAPFWAGTIIGITWGLWHLPAFYLASTIFADWQFFPFFIGNVTLAVLVTPIFNTARGSILLPMLFHWQLINPFWPDAQPWDTWILVALTVLVVLWKRDEMFTRRCAVTEVVPGC
jgi:hypothetical protein